MTNTIPASLELPVFQDNDLGSYIAEVNSGWRMSIRVVEFAMGHGFKIENTSDRVRFGVCQDTDGEAFLTDVTERGGLCDQAIEYLDSISDDGLYWIIDGDFFLRRDEEGEDW